MYLQNKLPLPPFLLLENTVPDFFFFVNIHFVTHFLFFFFLRNVQDASLKKNGFRIKTMKYFTVFLVQSTWLLAQG